MSFAGPCRNFHADALLEPRRIHGSPCRSRARDAVQPAPDSSARLYPSALNAISGRISNGRCRRHHADGSGLILGACRRLGGSGPTSTFVVATVRCGSRRRTEGPNRLVQLRTRGLRFFVNDQPNIRRVDGSNCRAGRRMPTATALGLTRYAQFSLGHPPASDRKTLDNWPIRPADSIVLREAPPHRRGFHRPCVVRRVRRSCSPTKCADLGIMRRAVRARLRLA